ncbi:MAG: aspartate aminotransferase [Gammaproteobacteria bacterium]|nr:pyridoxal phosphate-dependent aminotransferase [Gammaproteobacteria bacterium]PCH64428.1 MAG: aspartate aminotransferase [Gammaproteobacteria bacterium]
MTIKLARRTHKIKPSATLAITAKANALKAAGEDVIGLGAGEPDFDTPAVAKQAAIDAINSGMTKYTAVAGTIDLRQAICDKFRRENKLDYELNQILVSVGAKHSIYNLCQALLDNGDEVIIPAPYWVSYPDMVQLAEGTPVIIHTEIEQHFKITAKELKGALTNKTRLLILNSPSNPTGSVYSASELRALGDVLADYPKVVILSDDIYEHIYWSREPFCNIVNVCPELIPRSIVINGVSKAYAMTGWRIGYAAGPVELISAMTTIQSQSTSNATSIAQAAATAALNSPAEDLNHMVEAFKQRHDYVVAMLNSINGIHCIESTGSFYAFPHVQGLIDAVDGVNDDVALAEYLISELGVALVPGSAFGAPGYMRLSFATDLSTLKDALTRIAKRFN